jgi:hypothetical protein
MSASKRGRERLARAACAVLALGVFVVAGLHYFASAQARKPPDTGIPVRFTDVRRASLSSGWNDPEEKYYLETMGPASLG